MNGNKVIFIGIPDKNGNLKNGYGFEIGNTYVAVPAKRKVLNSEMICVIDKFGEEYAYPTSWFSFV